MAANLLLDALQGIRRRVRAMTFFFGLGICVATAVGLLLLAVFIDWALVLPAVGRAAVLLGAVTAILVAIHHWIVRPASSVLSISDIAGRLEHTFPAFDDRLRSTVDFLRPEIPGSDALKQRVISQATKMAGEMPLGDVVRARPMWMSLAGGVGALALVAGLLVFGSHAYVNAALDRLALGNRAWPKSVEIAMDGELPRRVAVGDRVPVRLHLAKGDRPSRTAIIEYRYDNGPWQQELMTRIDGVYTASLDAHMDQGKNAGRIEIKLQSGDDQRELAPIAIVPRLDIASVDADVLPPTYVKPRRQSTVNLADRPAVVGVGSDVALRFTFNKPLDAAKPIELRPAVGEKLPASVSAIVWEHPSPSVAVARLQAVDGLHFSIRATDQDGFENNSGAEYQIVVREDQPPTVQIEEPRRSEDRTPDAEFDVKAVAEDDYGIDNAQLVVHRLGDAASQPQNQWTIDLVKDGAANVGTDWELTDSSVEHQRYHLQYHWVLAALANANLKPGDVLEYFIQVKDNFDLNGKQHDWVPSGRLRITIISHEQWDRAVRDELDQTYAALKQLNASQIRNKGETDTLRKEIESKNKFDNADAAQGQRLTSQQNSSAAQTAQIADRLGSLLDKMSQNKSPDDAVKQATDDVKKQLSQTSDGPMRDAARKLGSGTQNSPADAKSRAGELKKSSDAQQVAADQLKAAMDRLGNFDGLSEAISTFEAIRDAQAKLGKDFNDKMKDNLGKKPEELSKEDQDKAAAMSRDQNALSKRTDSALNDLQRKGDQLSKTDPTASQGMKDAAQTGQQQKVPGKQQQAAQSMAQNQQADAQSQQAQIQLGLDMIINKLKEADQRKLEELARQLDDMQKLLAELVRRQASHNLDNLWTQGGQARVDKVESKDRQALIDASERDPKQLGAAQEPAQLSGSQEQTERNARDVAKQAESLPDPIPSAKLTAAAGQMERAIVHLRDAELPDAYDPPQVGALQALLEARAAVQGALQKAQDKLQQQTEENIKQAYIKLLEKQKKIGGDIAVIDGTPKDENGDLPRLQGVRLGQLPGEQGALAGDATEIGKKLETLGSIVFLWSNRDIVSSMNEVKDDLGKPVTGVPTQAEEHRIESQIQAMIDSLVEKQKNDKFAERQGGGKGGGGSGKQQGPKMPGEAELRLTKALQQAIATSTITIDAAKVKDVPKLAALGQRQGQLRGLFDQIVQKAAHIKLDAEPDNRDQLPEEASKEDVENQEFDKQLRNDDISDDTVTKGIKLTGDRMARSRQRLALNNDPGAITQEIQKRITIDLDNMIALAQKQQQQQQGKPGSGKPGDKMKGPTPGQGQQQVASGQKNDGTSPAGKSGKVSDGGKGDAPDLDLSKQIQESAKEWGGLTAREREAVQEGAGEKVIEKYKKFVDDYYRSLSEEATKH
jgi:hypothetical protein